MATIFFRLECLAIICRSMLLWLIFALLSCTYASSEVGGFRLPPAPIPQTEHSLIGIKKIQVKRFVFDGNKVISEQQLSQVTAPYLGKFLSMQQLMDIREELSRYYIDRGYINSGAILADQQVKNGEIRYQLVEGQLSQIEIRGNGRISPDFLLAKIKAFGHEKNQVLNLFALQKSLKLLQQSPLIESIDAQLKPGLRAGQGYLDLSLQEAKPYELNFRLDNHRSPSIGALRGQFELKHQNLFGYGERFYFNYGLADDQDDYQLNFSIPLDANSTRASMSMERDSSAVLSEPFNALGFRSDLRRYSFALSHRLKYSLKQEMTLGLQYSLTENDTQLLGEPFAFPPGVAEARVNELSIFVNWVKRDRQRVLAMRSELGFGLPGLGATERSKQLPDGRFIRWNGQFQWLQSLPFWSAESLFRFNFQLSADNLLSINQIAAGGANTVRGYRENTLVRDNAVLFSWETHIPITQFKLPGLKTDQTGNELDSQLKLVPFFDYAYAWNHNDFLFKSEQIYSVGLGLIWKVDKRLSAQIYWGKDLQKTDIEYAENIQDQGIHMQLVLNLL